MTQGSIGPETDMMISQVECKRSDFVFELYLDDKVFLFSFFVLKALLLLCVLSLAKTHLSIF